MKHNVRDAKGRFCKERGKVFIEKKDAITAYKVFNENWTCKCFQYRVGKSYKHKGEIKTCHSGFHCCENLSDCFNYYPFNSKNRVAIVKVWGEVAKDKDKLCASNISIIKELNWYQVLDIVNTGKGNTGYRNIGDSNEGNYNTGSFNKGSYNTGYNNTGDSNTGNRNKGNYNTGNCNIGSRNTGDSNTGDSNKGCYNSGHYNTGSHNEGCYNTGFFNTGDHNTGFFNSGNYNTGYYNLGDHNSGDYNTGYYNTGMFNTAKQNTTFLFNKPVPKEVLLTIKLPTFFSFSNKRWVPTEDMTEEEKKTHPNYKEKGGYAKNLEYKEAFREAFLKAKKEPDWPEQLKLLKAIPNFDADIFYEISGIKPEELK